MFNYSQTNFVAIALVLSVLLVYAIFRSTDFSSNIFLSDHMHPFFSPPPPQSPLGLNLKPLTFQFLDNCTASLRLSSAARRLFVSPSGKELFSLAGLERDQVVYVSTGDHFLPPDQLDNQVDGTNEQSGDSGGSFVARLAGDVRAIEQMHTMTAFHGKIWNLEIASYIFYTMKP